MGFGCPQGLERGEIPMASAAILSAVKTAWVKRIVASPAPEKFRLSKSGGPAVAIDADTPGKAASRHHIEITAFSYDSQINRIVFMGRVVGGDALVKPGHVKGEIYPGGNGPSVLAYISNAA